MQDDNQIFHLILCELLNKSETSEEVLTSFTASLQVDADVIKILFRFKLTNLLTDTLRPAGFTISDLFF